MDDDVRRRAEIAYAVMRAPDAVLEEVERALLADGACCCLLRPTGQDLFAARNHQLDVPRVVVLELVHDSSKAR